MRLASLSGSLAVMVAWGVVSSPLAWAQEQTSAVGDSARGKTISYTCLGCHGIPGYKNAFPNYRVPKLNGQHSEYIVTALQAYRAGDRSHLTMHSQASTLSDQDIADIAAFFAGEPLKSDGKAEGKPPQAAQVCVACHGPEGIGITPMYPNLAGQHADYLERALRDYQNGGRKNPIMAPMAAPLTEDQIAELAAYYSQQRPALKTEERPSSRFTSR